MSSSLVALAIAWKGGAGALVIEAPEAHHVAVDAPVDVHVAWGDYAADVAVPGDRIAGGIGLPDLRGQKLTGTVSVSVCTDAGNECQRQDVAFYGAVPDMKKGRVPLVVSEAAKAAPAPAKPTAEASPWKQDANAAAKRAMDEAARDHETVLLDFTAVWCPPCNQLAIEVLDAPERPPALDGFVVARIDVDDPSSFALKDKYQIQGYPTVIAVRPDGTEVGRQLGYSGKDAFVAWLADAAKPEPVPSDPASVDPATAAKIAWRIVETENGDPKPWIERAKDADTAELRLARVSTTPNLDDAKWLLAHDQGHALEWVGSAMDDLTKTADGKKVLQDALIKDLAASTRGPDAADLVDALAELSPDADQPGLYAASAALIRSSLTGDPKLDRPYYTSLGYALEHAGQPDAAVAVLDGAAKAFPDEMTYWLSGAKILLRAHRPQEALDRLDEALPASWGDNRLRVATSRCEALVALGRKDEAKTFAASILAEIPPPAEGQQVRASRYRDDLGQYAAGEDPNAKPPSSKVPPKAPAKAPPKPK